ncbi:Na+/H+ antiporter subunit E [Shinella curvata]|uniref:Na+/H+ antiporter subunit E n=1 Tax=Shinella curvata TaxID=1817964 RepID=A0ABT8XFW6_9HYPH|nr:Na+/H+ antiporter subunit E [Shinella curvata]MCJ8053324.1 Na+/H+ antiporter subunit E [Shinella curvata]MDO6122655.1 Na+/H+ antiporter subunit E [Shinella curvata]
MRPAVIIAVFTLVWLAVSGSFTIPNLVLGIAAAALSLLLVRGHIQPDGRRLRPLKALSLLALFLRELALSAWKVAVLVVRPKMDLKPGIFAFPLTVDRDFEITLLANLITLTPGTLSVDVSEDRKTLYVHALDCSDPAGARRDIANGFEKKILEAFR